MRGASKIGVGVFLLFVVLAVCISPFVDLAPTILRSQVLCSLLFAAIAVAGTALVSRTSPVAGGLKCVISPGNRFFLRSNLLALNCSRLC
jgi:hypothetical protein